MQVDCFSFNPVYNNTSHVLRSRQAFFSFFLKNLKKGKLQKIPRFPLKAKNVLLFFFFAVSSKLQTAQNSEELSVQSVFSTIDH